MAAAAGLRESILGAARADVELDDALMGMAAAQCARHKQGDLMGLLCAQALFRLARCSGRTVAELASAAAKLGCVEPGFARAIADFCTSPPKGAFTSIRDIAMVASALRLFTNVDHASVLCGLAEAAMPYLTDAISQRDLADLLHQLAQLLFTHCSAISLQRQRVVEVLSVALNLFARRLHRASAMDVAVVAGVTAGLWSLLEGEREAMLRPLLMDIAQLVRFRRTEFNPQDLSNLAIAFAKVGLANSDVADVLDEQTSGQLVKFSNKDVALLLCAAARLPVWSNAPFAKTISSQLLSRDLTKFSSQDLCSSAQSLAKLGGLGAGPLQRIADEAFQRQLCAFTGNDKAILLWSLAKVRSKHSALLRILVRGLAVEDFSTIDRDLATATIWSLARIWQQLPPEQWPPSLVSSLCALCPWVGATTSELCCTVWGAGELSAHVDADAWWSLVGAIGNLTPSSCSLHELCLLLCGLSSCEICQLDQALPTCFSEEVVHRIRSCNAEFSEYDKQLLKKAFTPSPSNSWEAPPEISDLVAPRVNERLRAVSFDEFNDSEIEYETFAAKNSGNASDSIKVFDLHGASQPGSSSYDHGHGHGHGSKDVAELTHDDDVPQVQADWTGQSHGQLLDSPAHSANGCCPPLLDSSTFGEIRLNEHCDFSGHCIQMKNTFIHVHCNHSESENEDCVVCKITRSRSCDVEPRARYDSDDIPRPPSPPPPHDMGTEMNDADAAREGSPTRGRESRGRRMRRQKRLISKSSEEVSEYQ